MNQTLSRTIITGGATLIVVLLLFFIGGSVIHDFAFALLIGILIGTYSSIFIASPLVVDWHRLFEEGRTPASKPGKAKAGAR